MIDRFGISLLAAGIAGWCTGIVGAAFAGLLTMVVIGAVDGARLVARLGRDHG